MKVLPALCLILCGVARASMVGETIDLYDVVPGFIPDGGVTVGLNVCSPPGTKIDVNVDDGTTLTVSIHTVGNTKFPLPATCNGGYTTKGTLYQIPKSDLAKERYNTQAFVTGVLAIPFKLHPSTRAITPGGSYGAYVGYRTSLWNAFTVTPVLAGGLALVSAQPIGSSNTQTLTGFSMLTGLIGTVNGGLQFGGLIGIDWVAKSANYTYNGKFYFALEIGYAFNSSQ